MSPMESLSDSSCAQYIAKHVYLAGKLPQECDFTEERESALAATATMAAEEFSSFVPVDMQDHWSIVVDLLSNLARSTATSTLDEEEARQQLRGMTEDGDIRVFLIRLQNAAVVMRRQEDSTIFESFEISPSPAEVLATKGRLHCTYPGPAVLFPHTVLQSANFVEELVHFLAFMDVQAFEDAAPKIEKAKSPAREDRDNAHPRYITELLTALLLGRGEIVDVPRICKRIRDEVLWSKADKPWRRSSLWLVIRVVLQTTLERHPGGATLYKSFLLFLQATFLKHLIASGEVVDSFDSDTLFCMSAKISRRAYKLEQSDLHPVDGVLSLVLSAAQDVKAFLELRHAGLLRPPPSLPPLRISSADLERDKILSLTNSRPFIERALTLSGRSSTIEFTPSHPARSHDFAVLAVQLEKFLADCPDEEEKKIILVDFEHGVAQFEDVEAFCAGRSADDACAVLNECIQVYHRTASTCYDGDPVNMSIMFLTSLLLWTALDRRMLEECAMLWEYRPDIELGIFDALLLRDETRRDLLSMARDHLDDRLKTSTHPSVLTQSIDSTCFPTRFFEGSTRLQELKHQIQMDAALERARKTVELERKGVELAEHRAAAYRLDHERNTWGRCYRGCSKCSYQNKAESLSIDVHEWPLPQDDAQAKACVFEVGCSRCFVAWRDATQYASSYIFSPRVESDAGGEWYGLLSSSSRPYTPLLRYRPSSSPSSRIVTLGSSTKSFLESHYSSKYLKHNPGRGEICVNNGLIMQVVDSNRLVETRTLVSRQDLFDRCTYRLPEGIYSKSKLDFNLAGTRHTSNDALAHQSNCDGKLSIHEFYEFATLRSGPQIQWPNLLRQLRGQSLDFKEEAVHVLVSQAVLQIGDRDGSWHAPLSDHGFCAQLLDELGWVMDDIEDNCLQLFALRTIIEILQRLLSRTRDMAMLARIYLHLRSARRIVLAWVKELIHVVDKTQMEDAHARIRTMSAVCLVSFDAEEPHLSQLLRSPDDIDVFVRCAIYLFDNMPGKISSLPPGDRRLVNRSRRLLVRAEPRISRLVHRSRLGLDAGIAAVWPGYTPDFACNWTSLGDANGRWMTCTTSGQNGRIALPVHFNLLTGSLLVNGQSLGRLPAVITCHPTYSQLFEGKVLDVLPATVPGMQYMTSGFQNNHQIFFGLHEDDLYITAKRTQADGDSDQTFCLIPRQVLAGDVPAIFVRGHQHWLDVASHEIVIRSYEQVLDTRHETWSIAYRSKEMTRLIDSSDEVQYMLDIRSPTAKRLAHYLDVIESSSYQVVTWVPSSLHAPSRLEVALPRSGFSFEIDSNEGHLLSREMSGFRVDPIQFTGTMLGLRSQLVLTRLPFDGLNDPEHIVLIPRGEPIILSDATSRHVKVLIAPSDSQRIEYNIFRVDDLLGRLKFQGSPDIYARLQQIYLHGVTSLCLPDPLTGQTGTEIALQYLDGAGCFAFERLTASEMRFLNIISELTPARSYYPRHLECMETVDWREDLGFLAQDDRYSVLAGKINRHRIRGETLSTGKATSSSLSRTGSHLNDRAVVHQALFKPSRSYLGTVQSMDCPYVARHSQPSSPGSRVKNVVALSKMVLGRSTPGAVCTPVLLDIHGELKKLNSTSETPGIDESLTTVTLDARFLSLPGTILLTLIDANQRVKPSESSLLFTLGTLSYDESLGWSAEQLTLVYAVAYFKLSRHGQYLPAAPSHSSFQLSDGMVLDSSRLRELIEQRKTSFSATTYASITQSSNESWDAYDTRRRSPYLAAIESESKLLLGHFTRQWSASRNATRPFTSSLFDMDELVKDVQGRFDSWRKNRELHKYSENLAACLRSRTWSLGIHVNPISSLSPNIQHPRQRSSSLISFKELLQFRDSGAFNTIPLTSELQKSYPVHYTGTNSGRENNIADALSSLPNEIESIGRAEIFRGYAKRLRESTSALSTEPSSQHQIPADAPALARRDYLVFQAKERELYSALARVLGPRSPAQRALSASGLWPSTTKTSVLRVLCYRCRDDPDTWRSVVAYWAQAIVAFQTSRRRMLTATHPELLAKDLEATQRELCFDARYLDWLLLQIDADIAIRDVQYDIAQTMIADVRNESLCLQLNMGEGKTSVIAPMVACAIANGSRAPRIVVLKPLAVQMSQTMSDRLSGLVNRRVYHLPFSRTTPLDNGALSLIEEMLEECVSDGGVLIAQPEHILSLKLRATGSIFWESDDFGRKELLQRVYRLLADNARDILDESDEILHVRYQLVYTWGSCDHLQGHPDRWITTQELLRLVASHLRRLERVYPTAFISQGESGGLEEKSFPPLRLLDAPPAAAAELLSCLVDDVLSGQLSAINTQHLSEDEKGAMRAFISSVQISDETRSRFGRMQTEKVMGEKAWNALLLVRGLLALGVLIHALGDKRYRVDYGLDPSRSQLAVPYRAKDVPATSAEFAHPDVIVLLTCLSYYLTGLDDSQIGHCISMVGNLDDPETEYANWVSPAPGFSVSGSLARFKGVNFDSSAQRSVICRLFRHNQVTIDFYLRSVVFPKEAKQFESRLACSAWDLVEPKRNITTGFSGTNDFQDLLPLHITQRDPREQLSTNARVLNILLRPKNDHYEQFSFPDGKRFIDHISKHQLGFRMILDVGAQIPDLDNAAVVRYWLIGCTKPEFAIAAIYVDKSDRLTVLHRNGHQEPLSSSYINQPQQLSKCIVYLDEAHTRGIDLQLPAGFRAAVTLGPKVSKDRLVQGCMRLRRLPQGDHTVAFFGPFDVDRKIRRVARVPENAPISVKHVLLWAISESCLEVNHRSVQWLYQGLDHKTRRRALDAYSAAQISTVADSDTATEDHLREAWIQPESRTLDEMYGMDADRTLDWFADTEGHPEIRERALALGLTPGAASEEATAILDEEQEREVAHEIEREQQIERPPPKEPEKHVLHPEVLALLVTGDASRINACPTAFLRAFPAFKYAGSSAEFPDTWVGDLWATRDFFRTVKTRLPEREYFRPVHWVLSCPSSRYPHPNTPTRVFIVISPFEANELLPAIMKSKHIRLHLFAPRVTLAMRPCDSLSFFTLGEPAGSPPIALPTPLRIQLILLSGQLYLRDYAQYIALCELLGLYADDLEGANVVARSDGFIRPSERTARGVRASSPFFTTPVPALTSIMNIRRKGMSFDQTHIGKILAGRRLFAKDFMVIDNDDSSRLCQ